MAAFVVLALLGMPAGKLWPSPNSQRWGIAVPAEFPDSKNCWSASATSERIIAGVDLALESLRLLACTGHGSVRPGALPRGLSWLIIGSESLEIGIHDRHHHQPTALSTTDEGEERNARSMPESGRCSARRLLVCRPWAYRDGRKGSMSDNTQSISCVAQAGLVLLELPLH